MSKNELNARLSQPLTASALKKTSLAKLQAMVDAQPIVDNSSFLTPTLQEVLDGLTVLEKAILVAHLDAGIECNGAETLDAMRADNMTWSDVAETSKRTGLTKKQVNGVLSSLSTKGLLVTDCDPVNGEGAVQQVLDDFGIVVAFELLAAGVVAQVKTPTTRGVEDRVLVHPTTDLDTIRPIRAGTKRHLMAVALARGTTLEQLAEITGWSRSVVSAAIYTDFKAAPLSRGCLPFAPLCSGIRRWCSARFFSSSILLVLEADKLVLQFVSIGAQAFDISKLSRLALRT